MVTILDCGVGNIKAFANVYGRLGVQVKIAKCAGDLADAKRILFPGVGAFDEVALRLNQSGMRSVLTSLILEKSVPFLGICVGMQMLADGSEEGIEPGLGCIPGRVLRFSGSSDLHKLRVPHMGWNDVETGTENALFRGLGARSLFYFLHSYYFQCALPHHQLAYANYGGNFAAAVWNQNIFGVQFHPEKSHSAGETLLKNFSEI